MLKRYWGFLIWGVFMYDKICKVNLFFVCFEFFYFSGGVINILFRVNKVFFWYVLLYVDIWFIYINNNSVIM